MTNQVVSIKKLSALFFAVGLITVTSCKKEQALPQSFDYFSQVKTITQKNCISCHYQGGQGMPVILTADSDIVSRAASIKAATCNPPTPYNMRMPLGSELSDADKATITSWFEGGATANN